MRCAIAWLGLTLRLRIHEEAKALSSARGGLRKKGGSSGPHGGSPTHKLGRAPSREVPTSCARTFVEAEYGGYSQNVRKKQF
mmetsp:Transcript_41226/g.92977  ORF Transcript_41226/g.92977 Transcript_41226/m.92977 type:complete len:82 (-) Transcript_41226:89-334(-)